LPYADQPTLESLDQIYVTSLSGASIPLRSLATWEFEASPLIIDHYNRVRSSAITADVQSGYSVNRVTKKIIARLNDIKFPRGYRFVVGGELESQEESFAGMTQSILVALLGVLAVLVLQFRSFSQSLIIFSAIPLSMIGVTPTLLLTGNTFSFTAFVGLTSLVGIVVNNAIILVDYTNQLRRQDMELDEALLESCRTRFIPIFLTTATTIGGLLPLALGGGTLWAPMAWTIIGGLTVSTLLTLFVVPALYKLYTPRKSELI
ncbi:MAG: efflux RND transporter permease subunit, partial [Calditrichaeota bacterium]